MPYVKDTFYAKVEPYADIFEVTTSSYDELEADFKIKYDGVKAIYRCRAPGTIWGSLGEEFFKRVPSSCKVVSHRECCEESSADRQWELGMMTSTSQRQRSIMSP
jgi:hypothetical protein